MLLLPSMNRHFQDYILQLTGAEAIHKKETVQHLWSEYGEILRVFLQGATVSTAVVKFMHGEQTIVHPRGWHSNIGHERKIRSYQVESTWYRDYAERATARLPRFYGYTQQDGASLTVLEDLDAAGFPIRLLQVTLHQIKQCIAWLAQFHADFLGAAPNGLWPSGTYWHLETRPNELEALEDQKLKSAAPLIDARLKATQFQTLVHGDAKLANFCFGKADEVAAVDFQYVGGGCGMKDLAYFVGSCLNEDECEAYEEELLDYYFDELRKAQGADISILEAEWRPLYHVAWADFHRFLKGWSPDHWKINSYSERVSREVINQLNG